MTTHQEPCTTTVNKEARAIASLQGDTDHHRFIVGTTSVRDPNEIQLLEYHDEHNEITCPGTFPHPGEVWGLYSSPTAGDTFFSLYSHQGSPLHASLWQVPAESLSSTEPDRKLSGTPSLRKVGDIETPTSKSLHGVVWSNDGKEAVTLHNDCIRNWAVEEGLKEKGKSVQNEMFMSQHVGVGAWDPHHTNIVTTGDGGTIRHWDVRTNSQTSSIDSAHGNGHIRDIDYNPNKPWHFLTAGDDSKVKIWDMRKPGHLAKVLSGHSHWVFTAKFNKFHDQLILSGGTDSIVNLWRISSISSAPLLDLADDSGSKDTADTLVKAYDDHEDSVYSLAWSSADPWIFASLSYDGRVVVDHVPSVEVYKILL